jgi:hypothetical protein
LEPKVQEYLKPVDVSQNLGDEAVKYLGKKEWGNNSPPIKGWVAPDYSQGAYLIDGRIANELGVTGEGGYINPPKVADLSSLTSSPITGVREVDGKLQYVGTNAAPGMTSTVTDYFDDGTFYSNYTWQDKRGGFLGKLGDFLDDLGPLTLAFNFVAPGLGTGLYAGRQVAHGNWGNAILSLALANVPGPDGAVSSGFEGTFLELPSIADATKAIQTTLSVSPAVASAIMSGTLTTVAQGGNIEDAFKNIATSYLGNLAGSKVSDVLKAQGFKDLATIGGSVARSSTSAWLNNKNVVDAAKYGFISSAIPIALEKVPGYSSLSTSQKNIIASVAAQTALNPNADLGQIIKDVGLNVAAESVLSTNETYKALPTFYKDLFRTSLVAAAQDRPLDATLANFLTQQANQQTQQYSQHAQYLNQKPTSEQIKSEADTNLKGMTYALSSTDPSQHYSEIDKWTNRYEENYLLKSILGESAPQYHHSPYSPYQKLAKEINIGPGLSEEEYARKLIEYKYNKDAQVTDDAEARNYFQRVLGRTPTNSELVALVGSTEESAKAAIELLGSLQDRFKNEVGSQPTPEQLKLLSGATDADRNKIISQADNQNVTQEEFNAEFHNAFGRLPTEDEKSLFSGIKSDQALTSEVEGYKNAVEKGFPNYESYKRYNGDYSAFVAEQKEIQAKNAGFPDYNTQALYKNDINEYGAVKEGWGNYAEKQTAINAGFTTPTTWQSHLTEQKNQQSARDAGFPDYATQTKFGNNFSAYTLDQNNAKAVAAGFPDFETQTRFGNNVNEYRAVQEGWSSLGEKQAAAGYEITSPQKYQELISGKTEEDKIVQMLRDRGVPATPERVADIMKSWDFNPATPNVGFGEAFNKSDNLNISNSRADSVQEAAALAKSLGYSNFSFGGSEYKLNTAAPTQNPYDFFASFGEAYKAARADLGAGQNFEWRNPVTGETKTFSTNNEKEQAVADQKRIDLMPVYSGEGARTGRPEPGTVPDLYLDKKSGEVVEDTRVWDAMGNVVSGELRSVKPGQDTTAGRVASAINEGIGKAAQAFIDVSSGVVKGGANLLNQLGVLGGMTGLINMDNWATQTAKDINKQIDNIRSTDFKNNQQLLNEAINKAGDAGIVAQAIEAAKQFGSSPIQTAEFIAQNGVSLLLGGGAMATARALGAGMKTAEAAAIGTMAAAQGASVADETYKDAIKNGKTPEDALNSARAAWAGSALTSAVANKFIPGALSNESAIAAQAIAKNSISNALKGEMSAELAEEVSGKVIGNIAAGNAWDKDVGATAVQALIGSGVITGLVQVSTTGSPSTAIAIAKDAGLTDAQIDEAKRNFQKAIDDVKTQTQSGNKVESYDIPDAVEKLSTALLNANLSASEVYQLQNLIALDATQSAIKTSLENSGVPAEFSGSIANQAAPQILEGSDVKQAFDNLSVILQANGFTPVDASLITNKTLTGTDVRQEIAEQLESQGYKANPEEIDNLISQNATSIPTEIASAVSDYADAKAVNREEAKASLVQAGIENPTQEQINFLAGQYDQALLQGRADTAVKIFEEPNFVEAEILKNIENNKIAGMDEAAAIEKAVTDIASSVGQSDTDLLALIGRTPETIVQQYQTGDLQRQIKTAEQIEKLESQLTDQGKSLVDQLTKQGETYQKALEDAITAQNAQITAGQTQTQTQIAQLDAATKAKFDQLSDAQKDQALQLAETTKDLQGSINAVAQQTAQQIEAGQQQTAQQIASVKDSLTAQIAANEAAGLSRDEATTKAINDLSTQMGVDKNSLLTQLGTTEQALRNELQSGLEGVTKTFQDQYNALSATQKAQFDAMVEQGASTQAALAQVQAGLQEQITSGQQQTAEQIAALNQSLSDRIAANEASGLTRDQATSKAIQDVAASVGTTKDALLAQIGQTEAGLQQQLATGQAQTQEQIAQLDAATQVKFNEMTEAQKAQALQLAQTTKDLQGSINTVAQQSQQQISDVQNALQTQLAQQSAQTQQAFADMTAAQKEEVAARIQQGQDLQTAISGVQASLGQQITGGLASLSQDFQNKLAASDAATQAAFANMDATQKAETQSRVQQGQDLQAAIAASQQATEQKITGGLESLSQDFQSKLAASNTATQNSFAQMTAAQQQETLARVQQGVSLENAIAGVQTGLGEQITAGQKKTEQEISDLNKSLTDRITANEAAGLTRDEAIAKSVQEVAAGLGSTRETLLGQINQTETTLKQQYETGQAAIRAELEAQRAADEAAKQEAERKAREEAEKAAARSRMSTGAGILSGMAGAAGLAALGGGMPGTEEASKPLTAKYLTSKGGNTKFKGLLEEFQQEVEGAPNMPDNTANRQEGSDMSQYYSYGNETSLDQILGQDNTQESSFPQFFAGGGLATPLMAAGGHTGTRYGKYAGGGMPSPLMAAGGKMRVDFRRGDAVTGPGDGQSDDIPAMLADGEFVFPADVVAAIGNGSTKAGSDALYDMMHSIRKHARSARPKDLPPEIKSPLDFLKKSRNKRRAK